MENSESLLIETLNERVLSRAKIALKTIAFHAKIYVDHHWVKKNSRDIRRAGNRVFLGKRPELINAENRLILELRKAKFKSGLVAPITDPVWVMFHFHFANYYTKKGEVNKTLGDLSNLYQLPEDCLTKAGIIKDDSQIIAHDLSRRLPSEETFLEIFIFQSTGPL